MGQPEPAPGTGKEVVDMATSVIIPARNEQATIGAIVNTFSNHPETRGRVYVGIDADTIDSTAARVWENGGCAIHTDKRGKGQVVTAVFRFPIDVTRRVILCDGDYAGLKISHIDQILSKTQVGMTIGIPDWPEIELPERVISSWPRVSGFRCLPNELITVNAHGYMLETQLNLEAIRASLPIRYTWMNGLKSPFQWPLSPQRERELKRDQKWGRANGIL